jgi:hypothetical protein
MTRDDEVLTTAELAEVLGGPPHGDLVTTHAGDWRREAAGTWRFHWYPDCHPDAED